MNRPNEERLHDFLADRATVGLDADAQRQLRTLLQVHPDADDDSFEVAAAALYLALAGTSEAAPPALRLRLEKQGQDWLQAHGRS